MGGSFYLCFSSAAAAGVRLTPGAPWGEIPAGVVAVMGWDHRLRGMADVSWILAVARHLSHNHATAPPGSSATPAALRTARSWSISATRPSGLRC